MEWDGVDVRDEFNHDEEPADAEIPVKPIQLALSARIHKHPLWRWVTYIISFGTNDPAIAFLPPQPYKSNEILDNRHGPQQRSTDTEDGIGTQLVPPQTVPQAEIHANRHEDAVGEDERPEPEDGFAPYLQRVVERRRAREVGVIVCDLRVWVGNLRDGGVCSTCGRARGALCDTSGLSLIVVTCAVDDYAGDLQRVGIACCVCCGRAVGFGEGDGAGWPQSLRRGLLCRHVAHG
jgi:hypothetical protein